MKRLFLGLTICAVVAVLGAGQAEAAGSGTVTISGKAYTFNHMGTFIPGATIRVREDPSLTAVTDENGDYKLVVPQNATITPYIDPPEGWNQIDLQTFHTKAHDIANANFQTPADGEYNALAALLHIPMGDDGRPLSCVIVTTASARDVRGVDYQTFWDRTPHGVAGATSVGSPEMPAPIYFNEYVIPDPNQPYTSEDGGILWPDVDAGAYRISTDSPATDFAGFLATCAPGRIVNANPPWGAYELAPGEKPLNAGIAAGGIKSVDVRNGQLVAKLDAGEALDTDATLARKSGKVLARGAGAIPPGVTSTGLGLKPNSGRGRAKLTIRFTDAAGESRKQSVWVGLD